MNYLITNRRIVNDDLFADEAKQPTHELRFAKLTDNGNEDRPYDITFYPNLQIDNINGGYQSAYDADGNPIGLGSGAFFQDLHGEMDVRQSPTEKKDTLFFIHGFNVSVDDLLKSVKRLDKQFVQDKSCPIENIVAFSWPSNGKLLGYRPDQDDALLSGTALFRTLDKLLTFYSTYLKSKEENYCGSALHLLCHSMGNRVLERMLLEAQTYGYPETCIWQQVVLMAADVDNTCFESGKPLTRLAKMAVRTHVYYNKHDKALLASGVVKNKETRLGLTGPIGSSANSIRIVDCSSIKTDFMDHSYFLHSKQMIKDLKGVFKGTSADLLGRIYVADKKEYRLPVQPKDDLID